MPLIHQPDYSVPEGWIFVSAGLKNYFGHYDYGSCMEVIEEYKRISRKAVMHYVILMATDLAEWYQGTLFYECAYFRDTGSTNR